MDSNTTQGLVPTEVRRWWWQITKTRSAGVGEETLRTTGFVDILHAGRTLGRRVQEGTTLLYAARFEPEVTGCAGGGVNFVLQAERTPPKRPILMFSKLTSSLGSRWSVVALVGERV